MIRAAGILFTAPGNKVLFLKRSDAGDHAGEWCFPGGKIEDGETSEEAAKRETQEETGGAAPDGAIKLWARQQRDDVDFTTFVQRVTEEFEPVLNEEHTAFKWSEYTRPPTPLHPGCAVPLEKFDFTELDVARAIATGGLTSPQWYENMSLFDIRITGTGAAYRAGVKEYVWREPSLYLNDEFLARCNGLPVVWVHPQKDMLDSQEFADRVIGTVLHPYIKGDEVWAVCKIFDEQAISDMENEKLSTSPGVVFKGSAGEKIEQEDGSHLLIETKPHLLDHIAVVPLGVWDKGGEPSGIASVTVGEQSMTENAETKTAKEGTEGRSDADAGTQLDKLLSHLDSITGKLDGLASRMDAMEEEDRKDRARKDAAARCDMLRSKRDAGEEMTAAEKKELEGMEESEAKPVMADKAKKDAEESAGKEKEQAAELEKIAKEEKESAAAMEAKKDSQALQARLDAQAIELAELRKMATPVPQADADALASAQARCDSISRMFGERAAPPLVGESLIAYRKRLLKPFTKHSDQWKEVDMSILPTAAFDVAERQVYADAQVASKSAHGMAEGEFLMITTVDPDTGSRRNEFRGPNTIFKTMSRPARRVTGSFGQRGN